MNATKIGLIKESYVFAGATMAATNAPLVLAFYDRLFAEAPQMRGMFPADISVQAEKLESTLEFVIAVLSNTELLTESLRDLGARHAALGVEKAHYVLATDVLTATLAEASGGRWTHEHDAAWRDLLIFVCDTMIKGAELPSAA